MIAGLATYFIALVAAASPTDSVDVLLFNTRPISSLAIRRPVAQKLAQRGITRIDARGDLIELAGTVRRELYMHDDRSIILDHGKRRRIVRGTVTIRPRAGYLVVVARMATDDY